MIMRSLALSLSALSLAAVAQAQEADRPARPARPPASARGEAPRSAHDAIQRLIKEADRNNDGKLDAEELRTLGPKLREAARPGNFPFPGRGPGAGAGPFGGQHPILMLDTDGDGKVSKEEFRKGHEAMFGRLDRNSDGYIDESERPAFPMMGGPGAGGFGAFPFGPGAGGPPFGPGPDGRPFGPNARRPDGPPREAGPNRVNPAERRELGPIAERLRRIDANGDGKISRDEFKGGPKEVFDRLDRNKDGVIDRNDRPEAGERKEGEARPDARRPRDGEARPNRERPRDGEARPDRDRPRDGEARPNRERPRDGEARPDARRPDREEKRAEEGKHEHKHDQPKAENAEKDKPKDQPKEKEGDGKDKRRRRRRTPEPRLGE